MNVALRFLCLSVISSSVAAQALAPELAPLVAKYNADIAALETQRATAIAQAQKPYIAALAAAEKTATTAGKVAAVAALSTERTALTSGLMSSGLPADLPKELQNPRKTYLDAVARIRAAELPRRQTIDAAYLRALAGLGDKSARNAELAKQLADEKQRVLGSAPATSKGKQSGRNAVINGTFDIANAQGLPGAWTTAEGFKVVRQGTNSVLHASAKVADYRTITQDILLPPRARSVTLTGRVRGKIVLRDPAKSQGPPGLFVSAQFLDKNDSPTTNWIMNDGGSDNQWKTVTSTTKVPDDMKVLQVALVLKYVTGEFDFDDIEVEFR